MSVPVSRRSVLLLSAAAVSCAAPSGWKDADLMTPAALAARLQKKSAKPVLLHVGFHVLYRAKHIPDSLYAGPGNKPEGIEKLRQTVASLPKTAEIILYCGCCPWVHCPNMKPAYDLLKSLGYRNVKAVMIETNLSVDWVQKGYPATSGA